MALFDWVLSYWTFDEWSWTAVNDELGANNWTATSMTRTTWIISNCGSFDGSTKYVTLANSPDSTLISNAWTISYWMNKAWNPSSIMASIVSNDNSSWARQFVAWINTSWQFYFERAGAQIASWWTIMSNSTWYNVVVSYNWTNVISYLNAWAANTTNTMTALPTTANVLNFGRRQYTGSNKYFYWLIDEVCIRDRVLSSWERTELYNSGSWVQYSATASTSNMFQMF